MESAKIHNLADLIAARVMEISQARWIKLKPAARYSAIGEKRLISMAEAGDIVGFQDPDSGRGDWVFDRQSIDQYRYAQAGKPRTQAVDILRTLGA